MPIGIVSDSDFESEFNRISGEIKRPSPIIRTPTATVVTPDKPGRKEGDNNVPNSLRKIIGEESVINGRQEALALAEMFNVSPSSVSAYANGATSTSSYNEPVKNILSHINKSRTRSVKKAQRVLREALDAITPEKLSDVKVRDLAGIAKDMSAIIKNLEPEPVKDDSEKVPQFVVFAPSFIKHEAFGEVIKVNE
jgi:predicted transcriptional regulator